MLANEYIALRPLRMEDKNDLARLLNNKKIWDNLRDFVPYPYTEQDAVDFISYTHKELPDHTFAITHQDKFAGVIGLIPQHDVFRKSMELGFWIGEPFWGKGIVTIAVKLISQHAFKTMGISRLFSHVYEYNIASMRVLEKCGFQHEGISRKAIIKNEKLWDLHEYGLLKGDFSPLNHS
ncbi:MAG: GNAT family N-acetyltransferase [Ekhidna sp.]